MLERCEWKQGYVGCRNSGPHFWSLQTVTRKGKHFLVPARKQASRICTGSGTPGPGQGQHLRAGSGRWWAPWQWSDDLSDCVSVGSGFWQGPWIGGSALCPHRRGGGSFYGPWHGNMLPQTWIIVNNRLALQPPGRWSLCFRRPQSLYSVRFCHLRYWPWYPGTLVPYIPSSDQCHVSPVVTSCF